MSISTSLYRDDFKLNFGAMDGLIGNTIQIEIELFTKQLD